MLANFDEIKIFFDKDSSPLQALKHELFSQKKVTVLLKRDDLISEQFVGNKFRKLKYNLLEASKLGSKTLISFGGAYSNHLKAFTSIGPLFGFETICFVRGEELDEESNLILQNANNQSVKLIFVDRERYKNKEKLLEQLDVEAYVIPEGGTNRFAILGIGEMIDEILVDCTPTHICTATGTGGTFAGILAKNLINVKILGFSSFKKNNEIEALLLANQIDNTNFEIINRYAFGGYGKTKPELLGFINQFYKDFKIQLDPIYTGKMMFGLMDMIKNDYFSEGSTIVAIHTGGV